MFQEYQNNKLIMFNKSNFRDKKEYKFDDSGNIPVIEEIKQELETTKCKLDKLKQELDAEKIVSLTYKQELENVKKHLKQFSDTGDIEKIKSYDFGYSECTYCKIKDTKLEVLKYMTIIKHIYSIINNGPRIIKNTVLNIKTSNLKATGFTYSEELGISVQGADANKCVKEIILQCTSNHINYDIRIELYTGDIVEFKKCF